MKLIARGLFVVGGIAAGSFLINHYNMRGGRLHRSDSGFSSPERAS